MTGLHILFGLVILSLAVCFYQVGKWLAVIYADSRNANNPNNLVKIASFRNIAVIVCDLDLLDNAKQEIILRNRHSPVTWVNRTEMVLQVRDLRYWFYIVPNHKEVLRQLCGAQLCSVWFHGPVTLGADSLNYIMTRVRVE